MVERLRGYLKGYCEHALASLYTPAPTFGKIKLLRKLFHLIRMKLQILSHP